MLVICVFVCSGNPQQTCPSTRGTRMSWVPMETWGSSSWARPSLFWGTLEYLRMKWVFLMLIWASTKVDCSRFQNSHDGKWLIVWGSSLQKQHVLEMVVSSCYLSVQNKNKNAFLLCNSGHNELQICQRSQILPNGGPGEISWRVSEDVWPSEQVRI